MRDIIYWPPRDGSRRGLAYWGVLALVSLVTVVTFAYSAAGGGPPPPRYAGMPSAGQAGGAGAAGSPHAANGLLPLRGTRLRSPVDLRLLLADPPMFFDADRGTATPVPGLPKRGRGTYDLVGLGEAAGAAVLVRTRECLDCLPAGEAFVVRDGRAASLGPAWRAAPSADGRGVWLLRHLDANRCVLREVDLRGRIRHPERPIDCRARPRRETSAGLLVDVAAQPYGPAETVLLDPESYGVLGRHPRLEAVTPLFSLTRGSDAAPLARGRLPGSEAPAHAAGSGGQGGWGAFGPRDGTSDGTSVGTADGRLADRFTLIDRRGGGRYALPWPSRFPTTVGRAAGPDGRLLAVRFADVATSGPRHPMDVWVLDATTRRWQQLPDMPVAADVTATSMAWTADGRLVIVGDFERAGEAVVTWRPGDDHLGVRLAELHGHRGNAAFAVLPR